MNRFLLEREGDSVSITLPGDLFVDSVGELKEVVAAAVDDGVKDVTLDMANTKSIDASALELLLGIQNTLGEVGGGVKLIHVPKQLFHLLLQLRLIEKLNAQVG